MKFYDLYFLTQNVYFYVNSRVSINGVPSPYHVIFVIVDPVWLLYDTIDDNSIKRRLYTTLF